MQFREARILQNAPHRPLALDAANSSCWMSKMEAGAGEGIRTLDPNLGKVVLYP